MSNVLVRSAQGISLVEKRILFLAIAKMGGRLGEAKITAQEYSTTFDVDIDTAYLQLKNSVRNFRKRYITLDEETRKGTIHWEINWLSSIAYTGNEAYVIIKFNPEVYPYLFDLQQQFTKYQLKQACALRSIYSWRLLELLEQMKNESKVRWLDISIEDFWHAMDATPTHKRSFAELRRKILEPAIKELVAKDNWLIEWRAIKHGKRVAALQFSFQRNPQGRLDV